MKIKKLLTSYVTKFLSKCNRHQKIIYNTKKSIRIMPGATGKAPVQKSLVILIFFL
jgi:copper homeostasis protein CutC